MGHGLPYQGLACKMDDRFRFEILHGFFDFRILQQVTQNKSCRGVDCRLVSLGQVIEDTNVMPCLDGFFHKYTADITGTARHKNTHKKIKIK